MTKTALIDGDSFLYRAGFAVEKTKYLVHCPEFSEDPWQYADTKKQADALAVSTDNTVIWTRKEVGNLNDALAILDSMLRGALEKTRCSSHFLYLSPSTGNFRDSIATLRRYKGNRDSTSRPVYYSDLREYLLSVRSAIVPRGQEADDQISWVSRMYTANGNDHVIIGIDKDLKQIPGEHYNWVKDEHETITNDEATLNFWEQVLAGDEGDNVGGCYGLGEKGARKILSRCHKLSDEDIWPKVVRRYEESQRKEGCPYANLDAEEVALETARLVRLRQLPEEPLWVPKTKITGKERFAKDAADQENK